MKIASPSDLFLDEKYDHLGHRTGHVQDRLTKLPASVLASPELVQYQDQVFLPLEVLFSVSTPTSTPDLKREDSLSADLIWLVIGRQTTRKASWGRAGV